MNLGPTELIIVLVIVLVLFGGAKLPKLAKSLGEAQREFKKGTDEGATDAPSSVTESTVTSAPTTPAAPATPVVPVPPADPNDPSGPVA